MKIGELAKKCGVDNRTIDYYTNVVKILPYKQSDSSTNNYRDYDENSEKTLRKILFLREIGLSMKNIKEALDDPSYFDINRLKNHIEILKQRKEEADQKYQTMIDYATSLANSVEAGIKMKHDSFFGSLNPNKILDYIITAIMTIDDPGVDELFTSTHIEDLADSTHGALRKMQKLHNAGEEYSQAVPIIERLIKKYEENIGTLLYYGIITVKSLDKNTLGISDEIEPLLYDFFIDVLTLCAPWFLEANSADKIADYDEFRRKHGKEVKELSQKYQRIDDELSQSSFDLIETIFRSVLEETNTIEMVKAASDYLINYVSKSEDSKIIESIDGEYGEGLTNYVCGCLSYYLKQYN